MIERRALLTRIVGAVLGGSIVAGTATGRETVAPQTPQSDVSISLDTSVLNLTGVPAPLESTVAELERSTAISLADTDTVSARATVRGGELTDGWAAVSGAFDGDQHLRQLRTAYPAFEPLEQERAGAAIGSRAGRREGNSRTVAGRETRLLVNPRESTAVGINPSRAVVATGPNVRRAVARLVSVLEEDTSEWSEPGVPETVLDGDAVAHATLGDDVPDLLRSHTGSLPTPVVKLLRAVRWGGIALDAGRETSQVRYAARVDPGPGASTAINTLLDNLTAVEDVELLRSSTETTHIVTDVSVQTESLWTAHARVLDLA